MKKPASEMTMADVMETDDDEDEESAEDDDEGEEEEEEDDEDEEEEEEDEDEEEEEEDDAPKAASKKPAGRVQKEIKKPKAKTPPAMKAQTMQAVGKAKAKGK